MAKRQAKSNHQLQRNQAKQKPYDRVLIVCEGAKSEPFYFKSLIRDFRLSTADVEVYGEECDSSPDKVLEYAKLTQDKAVKENNAFDRIYCVIDKDSHVHYNAVIESIKKYPDYKAANSIPCFEYWVLLHFEYTDSPFSQTGNKSCCDKVKSRIKKYLPDYEKKDPQLYEKLKVNTDKAIQQAKRALKASEDNCTDNPSTKIHELVEYLILMKPK